MEDYVSLETLAGGAAIEQFNGELRRVLDNILDVNTEATKVREITLKVKVKPSADRESSAVKIEIGSKIASPEGVSTVFFIGRKQGIAVALEHHPKQQKLFDQPAAVVDITSLKEVKQEGAS